MTDRYWQNWDKANIAKEVNNYWDTSAIVTEEAKTLAADIEQELGTRIPILEVGCGTGRIYRAILDRHIITPDLYTGGDVSHKMLDIARTRSPEAKFIDLDILNLPYPDKSQPNVICVQVLQHLPHYAQAVNELIRITRERLYIASWFHLGFKDKIMTEKKTWGAKFHNNHYSLPKFLAFLYSHTGIKSVCIKQLGEPSCSLTLLLQ